MSAGRTESVLNAVPLLNAVFCVDCENISNSPHETCTICGSRSLVSLFRMLGGTLRKQKAHFVQREAKTASYNLEVSAKVHEVPASELNRVVEAISRLTEVGADLESLHLNVESVLEIREDLSQAA
jgi:hypothetical protein